MQTQDKTFVVTGAGNGIGREVALELLRRGARVAGVDLRGDALERTAALAGAGDRFTSHAVDITDQAAVAGLPEEVAAAHGHVDGLLNVAGIIQQFVHFAQLDDAEMHRVMDVNFWGTVHTTRAFLPHLAARPEACLVNVSSMGGFVPVPGQTLYGASKAAVKLLTEGIYAEQRGTSVAVSIVFPGAIGTDITANSGVARPGAPSPEEEATGAAVGMDPAGAGEPAEKKAASGQAAQTLPPAEAARIIVDKAVEKGDYRVTVGKDATFLDRLSRFAPQRATDMIAKKMASLLG
ncbi:SDR family NAD(P)-dependent oxidoreductase [Micrococcus endophyticus]|uniref:SDR family NAD(P)-dependent oxidoreductase n=1 Tax=Micrococcus endophyticus TaxID=455343 RepID=UPI0020056D72|nr:SDR family NAD(P)-dependent oxidoreductase [Micrococcus endophyticus]MCK6091611.1 SDR family NAD(P)-dependent oxidoreductase [Micrococcus endophyticus]